MLWMGETEALVTEVDPIRGMIRVTMGADLEVEVVPEELTKRKPQEEGEERKKKKKETKDRKEDKEIAEKEIIPPTTPPVIPTAPPAIPTSGDLEFSVFLSPDGTVFKIGALCFVESLTIPILITCLFKSTISGKLFVSGVRCSSEGGKILSLLQNFQVTVECLFVRPCSSSQFSMSSYVSSEVNHCVFRGQSRVCGCQERNFGNVHYLRDLRCHALGAQMRQAVLSGISLHATRPAQPISLGAFDPFSDMAIFGLSEMTNFRIPFSLVGGYSVLDSIMGKGWDVKPLRSDVDNCHFKYVSLFTVYLDKKNFILKCSFSYSEAPFSLSPDYREKCKALSQ